MKTKTTFLILLPAILFAIFGIGQAARATSLPGSVLAYSPLRFHTVQDMTAIPAPPVPAALIFSDQTVAAQISMTHATPITQGDGAQMISGAAAGDFNNDGWVDLYVIGGGLVADNLFVNNGDGTFEDMTLAAGLADLHLGSGAAVGDYNNDGWLDIFVTSFGPPDAMGPGQHLLYHNNGDLTFTNVASAAGVNAASPVLADGLGAAFGDYDLDGHLDLFVASWRKKSLGNRLFHNNGDGTFTDVTDEAGIVDAFLRNDGNGIRGFSPCFADMNGDRFPELLLAADFGTSRYFKNNGDGSFLEYTNSSGTGKAWSGMGSAVGDVNNDGLLDWFVTAIYDVVGAGRGDGNKLYYNQGNHLFDQVAGTVGVDDGGWGWGTAIVDLNHDGRPDIVETNGWDLPAYVDEKPKVWLQQLDGTFDEVGASAGLDQGFNGLGLLNLDYDNDGDQDVVITAYNDDLHLYRNDLAGSEINWLRVLLDTSSTPGLAANGVGSRIRVTVGDKNYYQFLTGCSHYLSQSELSAHFGLAGAQIADELRVEWANGAITIMRDVALNQTLTVESPSFEAYIPIARN